MNMIEKVARGICSQNYKYHADTKFQFSIKGFKDSPSSRQVYENTNWDQYVTHARAAIEAMRDNKFAPMLLNNYYGFESLNPIGKAAYNSVIDFALKE